MATADRLSEIERFGYLEPGFGARYDAVRPAPPDALLDVLTQYARAAGPPAVVDLASGTGLSTYPWGSRAGSVIGIEPSPEMRRTAEAKDGPPTVTFRDATAEETHLPDACADVVTAASSMNWFDAEAACAEAGRILRPGGVFAAYYHDWPPTIDAEVDDAFARHVARVDDAMGGSGGGADSDIAACKARDVDVMRGSGAFRHVRELCVHGVERGDARRLVDLARTSGSLTRLLLDGAAEADLGLVELEATASRVFGGRTLDWYFSYTIRVGTT